LSTMSPSADLQLRAINAVRFLSADAVQKANSGHPGLPMGAAPMAYALWMRHLRFNPRNPLWPNRDRFVLSGGHGSMLLYSLLHLTGYDLSLEEIKNFRQWESKTPGHPEYGMTPGVEATTGPLGQGFGNGVGMAIAAHHLESLYTREGFPVIDHFIYAIVTDGDLMEGVTSEAASLAGHLRLGRLIYLYDDNHITIDGGTDLAFTEDVLKRFDAYGWHTQRIMDGNDVDAIDSAIRSAQQDPRPSLIAVRTQIGYGLPTRAGTAKAHGEPPGEDELRGAKEALGWPVDEPFFIPEDVLAFYRQSIERGQKLEQDWEDLVAEYRSVHPDLGAELDRRVRGRLPEDWEQSLPEFPPSEKGMATRNASGKVINALAGNLPELLGGSADLAPSTKTWIDGSPSFQAGVYEGRNFNFGVREHGMGTVVNGMAVHGGLIPYGATFLVFSDYMRPAIRVAALSEYPSIWVFTHDSIGLGEDGPTHQPVEHLASLRVIPGLVTLRPADANEVSEAWRVAISRRHGPTALALTRQDVPVLDREVFAPARGLAQGAYVLADLGDNDPELILMASGSEVQIITEAGMRLAMEGVNVRLVSFPSWELFSEQDQEYRDQVLPPRIHARLAVEAAASMGWREFVGSQGSVIGIPRYGASAPYKIIYHEMGLTVENVVEKALILLREIGLRV
jgi:transketolase